MPAGKQQTCNINGFKPGPVSYAAEGKSPEFAGKKTLQASLVQVQVLFLKVA
jgi:hypothetical protein